MSQKIDFTKPVQTRDGRAVRILATDRKSAPGARFPVIGLVTLSIGAEVEVSFTADGRQFSHGPSDMDLVNVKVPWRTEGWVNIWTRDGRTWPGLIRRSKAEADRVFIDGPNRPGRRRIACIRLSLSGIEGEGLGSGAEDNGVGTAADPAKPFTCPSCLREPVTCENRVCNKCAGPNYATEPETVERKTYPATGDGIAQAVEDLSKNPALAVRGFILL